VTSADIGGHYDAIVRTYADSILNPTNTTSDIQSAK
jgi:hypothetical protein